MWIVHEGKPKPIWKALAAAFSPVSVSLDIWDRNFEPLQKISVPVHFFNDGNKEYSFKVKIGITSENGQPVFDTLVLLTIPPFTKYVRNISLTVPSKIGNYIFKAELLNKPVTIKQPVISSWQFNVLKIQLPDILKTVSVGIHEKEKELLQFAKINGLKVTDFNDTSASVLLASLQTWNTIASGDPQMEKTIQKAIDKGISVVLLDVGHRELGQGYPTNKADLGPLQGEVKIKEPRVDFYNLVHGVRVIFKETAEPESYLHSAVGNQLLWYHLNKKNTWLWNGLRGGLNVPASDMSFSGLSPEAFKAQWGGRGADISLIGSSAYYAYELQGFYAFSTTPNDTLVLDRLKKKVSFLAEDAPSLANSISPTTNIKITDLFTEYRTSANGQAQSFTALAECGKNLTRKPVVQIDFAKGKGRLVISQLLTSKRLAKEFSEPGIYGIRYDEAAVQMVLNMLALSINKEK